MVEIQHLYVCNLLIYIFLIIISIVTIVLLLEMFLISRTDILPNNKYKIKEEKSSPIFKATHPYFEIVPNTVSCSALTKSRSLHSVKQVSSVKGVVNAKYKHYFPQNQHFAKTAKEQNKNLVQPNNQVRRV